MRSGCPQLECADSVSIVTARASDRGANPGKLLHQPHLTRPGIEGRGDEVPGSRLQAARPSPDGCSRPVRRASQKARARR